MAQVCYCGKRVFNSRQEAERGLGRAQAKRHRQGDARGSRRGLVVESRAYQCASVDGIWHLTNMSRRQYYQLAAA